MKTVFVVIPVFNRWSTTEACLRLIQRQTYPFIETIVSDGRSTDATVTNLRSLFPDVHVLVPQNELWWGGAMKAGIDFVMEGCHESDFVLMMNNDTAFPDDFVETMVRISEKNDAAVGALTLDQTPPHIILDAGEFIDWDAYAFPVKTDVEEAEKFCDSVDTLPGRGSLVPVKFIRSFGNIDAEQFPHYISDYEFFYRLKRNGVKLMVTYETRVYSDTVQTGLHASDGKRPFSERLKLLTSRRSSSNFIDHYRFISRCAPSNRKKYLKVLLWVNSIDKLLRLERMGTGRLMQAMRRRYDLVPVIVNVFEVRQRRLRDYWFCFITYCLPVYYVRARILQSMNIPLSAFYKSGLVMNFNGQERLILLHPWVSRASFRANKKLGPLARKRKVRFPMDQKSYRRLLQFFIGAESNTQY